MLDKVDRPRGQSTGSITVTFKRGKWEIHEGLELVVSEPERVLPAPALVATVDPSKSRDRSTRGEKRSYSQHRLFDAY